MQRDTTQALALNVLALNTPNVAAKNEYLGYAIKILQDIDARTTSRDPSVKSKRSRSAATTTGRRGVRKPQ